MVAIIITTKINGMTMIGEGTTGATMATTTTMAGGKPQRRF